MAKRQMAMVMDLNKCIGCQTCTVACKTMWTNRNGRDYMYWNNVETFPGVGYPRNWQELGGGFDAMGNLQKGVVPDLAKDYGIAWEYNHAETHQSKQLKPHVAPTWGPNWDEDVGAGEFPKNNYFFYIPRLCNHCDNPGCVAACPRDAIFKRDSDGVVLIDQERCQGYRYCIAGCPYKKIYFNPKTGKSEKCIFCFPRQERGMPTSCAQQCVGRIRFVGFLDDEAGQVHKLVHKYKVAIPLRPDYGTQPNVYYVPPLFSPPKYDADGRPVEGSSRIPMEELRKLFGDEVEGALKRLQAEVDKRHKGQESELIDMLVAFQHKDMFRMDNGYYLKTYGPAVSAPIDERYVKGKFTTNPSSYKAG
ncbi:MAG: 4Fe-4S dicluster domain-containing protein [Campylobacterales bacterium]